MSRQNDTFESCPPVCGIGGIPDRIVDKMFLIKTAKGYVPLKMTKKAAKKQGPTEEEKLARAAALQRQIELHHADPNYESDYNETELCYRLAKRIEILNKTGK